MDIGLLFRLPLSARGYLLYQAVGSLLVNFVISFAFAWPKHGEPSIAAFGGAASTSVDTCLTAILLSALTVICGTWFVRRDRRRGVVRAITPERAGIVGHFPRGVLARAFASAVLFGALSIPLGLAVLAVCFGAQLTFAQFLLFKLGFALTLGAIVTPLNAAAVLIDRAAPSRALLSRPNSFERTALQ